MAKFAAGLNAGTAKGKWPSAAESALQGDLFTGKWQAERPKRGNGSNILLKPVDGQKPAVPGMASYAGEGPEGQYCKDCAYFGEVAVQRGPDDIETTRAGCALYARHMGHASPTTRGDIRFCPACKHFREADDAARRFIVDRAGGLYRIEDYPDDLRRWQSAPNDTPICPRSVLSSAETNQPLACTPIGFMEKR